MNHGRRLKTSQTVIKEQCKPTANWLVWIGLYPDVHLNTQQFLITVYFFHVVVFFATSLTICKNHRKMYLKKTNPIIIFTNNYASYPEHLRTGCSYVARYFMLGDGSSFSSSHTHILYICIGKLFKLQTTWQRFNGILCFPCYRLKYRCVPDSGEMGTRFVHGKRVS